MKKKLRMFLCAALTASMMATAPALVQAAEEKETTETTESNAVRQDLAGLKYDHSLELQYADQFSVDYYEDGYALITIAGDGQFLLVPEGKEAPEGLDSGIAVIKQPLDNIYLVATSAMDLFCALDGLDSISLSGTNADGWYIDEAKKALEDGIDTILTCDNGIAAAAEIEYAKKEGLTVIVTDHHDIPFRDTEDGRIWIIPKADAVVNPKQNDCLYPNKNICGAVVAWKLIWALYERLGIDSDEIWDFLELAAIATVGDVMDLQGENRIIVKEGLKKLSSTSFEGLKALICVNNLEGAEITAYHVGFVIGPCINASGRLDTAARSLELLLADNMEDAMKLADDLYDLNQSRKAMTEQGKEQAIQSIEENNLGKDRVLVVYLPDCHESLAGIIAGRIREAYNKPVFVLTKGSDGVKGSGRSIEAYSMYEELVKCSDLLMQFGGHPMAAGLSMEEKNVELFRRRLNDNCTLTEQDLIPKIMIDVPMPISYLSKKLTEQLKVLEPFGKGNSKPLFAQKNLRAVGIRVFGRNRNVAKMLLIDENGIKMDAVYFGEAQEFVDFVQAHDTISVTYYPEINVFQGRENLQVVIKNYC